MTTADELMAQARERTGLRDFGPDTFHEGLVTLVDGAAAAGTMNELGVAVLHGQAVDLLSSRLSIEDWYRRHPEIADSEILTPLFGLGLPRTGSTALSFLLAEDPRTRSLLTWETNSPTPPPDPETYDTDPRIAEAAARIAMSAELAPKFTGMLPSSPTGPNECLQILALDFRSMGFNPLCDNRAYEQWLENCDMVPAYEYHKRVLKLLQWKFPPRPWRLKSPAHMSSIDSLVEVYPDASFVMTHRDVAQVLPSLVSLFDALSEMLRTGPLAADFAENQAGYWERALRKTMAFRDDGRDDRFFDIQFADMQSDPLHEMARLYAWGGLDLTDEVAGRMSAWWANNSSNRPVVHKHRPEDYGIDVDALRHQFAFYNERFLE